MEWLLINRQTFSSVSHFWSSALHQRTYLTVFDIVLWRHTSLIISLLNLNRCFILLNINHSRLIELFRLMQLNIWIIPWIRSDCLHSFIQNNIKSYRHIFKYIHQSMYPKFQLKSSLIQSLSVNKSTIFKVIIGFKIEIPSTKSLRTRKKLFKFILKYHSFILSLNNSIWIE